IFCMACFRSSISPARESPGARAAMTVAAAMAMSFLFTFFPFLKNELARCRAFAAAIRWVGKGGLGPAAGPARGGALSGQEERAVRGVQYSQKMRWRSLLSCVLVIATAAR